MVAAVTTSNLAIVLVVLSALLFATGLYSRRVSPQNQAMRMARGLLMGLILLLAAVYFYLRFVA